MKKSLPVLLVLCALLLSACTPKPAQTPPEETQTFAVAATTWPVYCFTTAVTEGVDGVTVTPVINEPMSCLHDYTLTVSNMKVLEGADAIVLSGVGLEDFMTDALASSDATVIDCSVGVRLLQTKDGADDPHIWMDPSRAMQMIANVVDGLCRLDPTHEDAYRGNGGRAKALLQTWKTAGEDLLIHDDDAPQNRNLITFHEGFGYFADAFDLTVLKAIEEEEGSEASAREIQEIVGLIEQYQVPALFTEVNGSDATAKAISRETGVPVKPLSMIMSGKGHGMEPYLSALGDNLQTVADALRQKEGTVA